MAKSLNKVELIGYLGADVELKYTPQGTAVANVNIATTRSYKPAGGDEWQEETEWTPLVLWSTAAENFNKYTHKGSRVYIEGRLQTRSWEDKESGQKRFKTEVVVSDFILLDSKSNGTTDSAPQTTPTRPAAVKNTPQAIEKDEDLPF